VNLASVASRNLLRNRGRSAMTILGAAVALVAFIMLRTVIAAWSVGVDNAAKDRIGTRHKVSFILPLPKRYIDTVRAVPGVKTACFISWFGGKNPKDKNDFFASQAADDACLDVYDELLVTPAERQAWIDDRRGALIGDVLAKKLGVKVGDTVTLTGTIYPGDWQFNVRAIYTATRKSIDRSQFLFHWTYLNESIPERRREQIGWIVSRIDDPRRGPDISTTIDKLFDEKDVQTVTMSERGMALSFMAMLSAILTAVDIVSIAILGIMMLILGNTIAMGVRERTREYGVLRAIGFTPRHLALFVLGEAATLGLLAGLLSLVLAYPIVEVGMGRFLEENMGSFFPYFRIEKATMVLTVVVSVLLATIAAAIPAYRASKLSVVEALRRVA
jgi:putative ABC transport system permease protein